MSFDFSNDIEKVEIDELFAKAQEESLRFYNEVELPRLQNEQNKNENQEDIILSSQYGGKAGSLLYEGDDATGFHLDAGKTYIYPTNYPVRQYQATMVKTALFQNTMVSLPTGLGKTFIAAVVMYNFYRWYPNGKVVFMAPTRPLVAQQTKACHNIMNIPVEHTAELTGMQNAELREKMWKEKRVFYLTPQVMVNDLKSKTCPASLIKCIVIDEAHRATKDYAYCQVLKLLSEDCGALFRVLGLSATPGNDINAVQQVVRNLGISALEMRSEESLDVAPYTHSRSVDTIVVEVSGNIIRVKDDLLQVFEKYAKRLKDFKALSYNIANVSKFQILKACEKFRSNPPRGVPPSVVGNLISDFTVCMSLAHSLELLQTYGLRAFYAYLSDDNSEKTKAAGTRLRNDEDVKEMLNRLRICLFPKMDTDNLYTWSHPKLRKLVGFLTDHFRKYLINGGTTKAIIFCQYRVVVYEIVDLLNKYRPLVKAKEFIGQSSGKEKGMSQAKQLQILKEFRDGIINCLVATCVAEEGLDIGEVDLIILMEAHKSPIRLVQRIGRTGRKRKGSCVVLVTKGREEQKFHEAMATRKSYVENIMKSPAVKASLCQDSPRMIPLQFNPVQQLVHINVSDLLSPARPQIKKQIDIRKCFTNADSPFLSDDDLSKVVRELGRSNLPFDELPNREEIWHQRFDKRISIDELLSKSQSKLSEWNEWNHEEQETYHVAHTTNSRLLCHMLKLASKEIDFPDFETVLNSEEIPISSQKSNNIVGAERNDNSPNKRKKMKKDNVKKNLGMDIRNCMALAAGKSAVTIQKQIIEILSDDNDDVIEIYDDVMLKPSSLDDLSQNKLSECKQDVVTSLYMEGNKIFHSFEKYIPYNITTSKSWTTVRHLPKLETFFGNMTIEIIENLKFSNATPKKQNMVSKMTQSFQKILTTGDFVEIDDLFDTESDNDDNHNRTDNCLNTAISEFQDNENIINDQINQPMYLKSGRNSTDNEPITSCNSANNSKILTLSQQMRTILNKKSDIPTSKVPESGSNIQQLAFNEEVNFSDQSTKQSKFDNLSNKCSSTDEDVNKTACIVASTPNPKFKNFKKNHLNIKSSSEPIIMNSKLNDRCRSSDSDSSEMWNLSDLFEEEEIRYGAQARNTVFADYSKNGDLSIIKEEDNSVDNQNSTMLGITQMVSLIEKEKCQQKLTDSKTVTNKNNINNFDNNLNIKEEYDERNDNNLSDYLDCDVELFEEMSDESVMRKRSQDLAIVSENSKEKICPNKINFFSHSENKIPLCATEKVISSEDQLPTKSNNVTNNGTMDSQTNVVNFKKFTTNRALFSKSENSQSYINYIEKNYPNSEGHLKNIEKQLTLSRVEPEVSSIAENISKPKEINNRVKTNEFQILDTEISDTPKMPIKTYMNRSKKCELNSETKLTSKVKSISELNGSGLMKENDFSSVDENLKYNKKFITISSGGYDKSVDEQSLETMCSDSPKKGVRTYINKNRNCKLASESQNTLKTQNVSGDSQLNENTSFKENELLSLDFEKSVSLNRVDSTSPVMSQNISKPLGISNKDSDIKLTKSNETQKLKTLSSESSKTFIRTYMNRSKKCEPILDAQIVLTKNIPEDPELNKIDSFRKIEFSSADENLETHLKNIEKPILKPLKRLNEYKSTEDHSSNTARIGNQKKFTKTYLSKSKKSQLISIDKIISKANNISEDPQLNEDNSFKQNQFPSGNESSEKNCLINVEKPASLAVVNFEQDEISQNISKPLIKSNEIIKSNENQILTTVNIDAKKQCIESNKVLHVTNIHDLNKSRPKDRNITKSGDQLLNDNTSKVAPSSLKKPIWNIIDSDESDVFEPVSPMKKNNLKGNKTELVKVKKIHGKHKKSNEFVEKEAEVSGTIVSSDDSDGSSLDDIDNSFINDNSEYISNDTQSIYLKSVKSPLNKGNFKIPVNKTYYGDVYSQQVEPDSEYVNDSFCVDSQDENESTTSPSFLEIAERKLKQKKNNCLPQKKRRRILNDSQDYSSPDKKVTTPLLTMSQPSPSQPFGINKRRRIQSESETDNDSPSKKKHSTLITSKKVVSHKVINSNNKIENKQQNVINLSSDEENSRIIDKGVTDERREKEKIIDLTLDDDDFDSDSSLERKFQQDLMEAIVKSQAEYLKKNCSSQNSAQTSSKTSTPKSEKKILDLKKFDRSISELNKRFNERLNKIRSKFCSSDESD